MSNGTTIDTVLRPGNRVPIKYHHKFAVIDAAVVGTGSFNWTKLAETDNYENLVILGSKGIAKQFRDQFLLAWEKAEE